MNSARSWERERALISEWTALPGHRFSEIEWAARKASPVSSWWEGGHSEKETHVHTVSTHKNRKGKQESNQSTQSTSCFNCLVWILSETNIESERGGKKWNKYTKRERERYEKISVSRCVRRMVCAGGCVSWGFSLSLSARQTEERQQS